MLAAELLLLLYVGAFLAPDSALARLLIREPGRALAGLSHRKLVILAAVVFLGLAVLAPELVLLVGLADLSLLADLAAIGLVIGATVSFEAAKPALRRVIRAAARALRPVRRVRRRIGPRLLRPPRSDDVDDEAWVFA